METVIAAMVGLVGVFLAVGAAWIRAGFQDLRSAMDQGFAAAERRVDERFDKVDERFDKVDERFDKVDDRFGKVDDRFGKVDDRFGRIEVILRENGERIARLEGALVASGVPLALRPAAPEHPKAGSAAAEAAAG